MTTNERVTAYRELGRAFAARSGDELTYRRRLREYAALTGEPPALIVAGLTEAALVWGVSA